MDDLELVDLYALPRETARQAAFEDPDSIELPPGALSLEFLQAIYRSATQPMARRMKAASIAIAYESPKLSATLAVQADDSWAAKLKNAIALFGVLPSEDRSTGEMFGPMVGALRTVGKGKRKCRYMTQ